MEYPDRRLKVDQIEYLVFEGGGGKGLAFVGAIDEMSTNKKLWNAKGESIFPLKQNGQVKGVAGSSAGAITALFLSLGLSSQQIQEEMKKKNFADFFDESDPGFVRHVSMEERNVYSKRVMPYGIIDDRSPRPLPTNETPSMAKPRKFRSGGAFGQPKKIVPAPLSQSELLSERMKLVYSILAIKSSVQRWASFIQNLHIVGVEIVAKQIAKFDILLASDPVGRKIAARPDSALYSLLFDMGVFSGYECRRYFDQLITRHVHELPGFKALSAEVRQTPGNIGFADYQKATGIDLRIAGSNISKRKPGLFSWVTTPNFPVRDAVCISMNLPVIFKPFMVNGWPNASKQEVSDYSGFWIDGGLVNNFPLHCFDRTFGDLNKNVFGMRLTDGAPEEPRLDAGFESLSIVENWKAFLGAIAGTMTFYSEDGQLLHPSAKSQLINLYTYDIDTFDFAPEQAKLDRVFRAARETVVKYFKA